MDTLEPVTIRKFLTRDRKDLRRISCETAFHELKQGAVFSDNEILADALTLYYTDYESQSCFVAIARNRVVGYIIGTTDVSVMERISSKKIYPRLIWKALRRGVFLNIGNLRFIFYCLMSACKGELFAPNFSKGFPAMLHINIESGYRKGGIGGRLIKTFEEYLQGQRAAGVHFGTFSEGAKDFFNKMGYTLLFQGKRSYLKPYLGKEINFYIFGKQFKRDPLEDAKVSAEVTTKEKPALKERFFRLIRLNSSPSEIALGVAAGVFIAITPLYGFHTIMAIIAAVLIRRANKIAILLGTSISTTLTFPFITWGGYNIGRLVLGNDYPALQWQAFRRFSYKAILEFYYPLFIGSVILGLALAVVFYFLTLWFARRRKKARKSALVVFLLLLSGWLQAAAAADYTGEKISYEISPLGIAEYNDIGIVGLEGKQVKLVTFKTDVFGFYDLEKIYCDPDTLLPLRVERDISFLFSKEHLVEKYDPAAFSLITKKYVDNKEVKEYHFNAEGPIHNAILLPFYLRSIDILEPGWSLTIRLPDVYKISLVSISEITVPAGKFKAYHFASQPQKFEIWISQDAPRLPLKIKDTGDGYTMVMKSRVFDKK